MNISEQEKSYGVFLSLMTRGLVATLIALVIIAAVTL